MIGGAICTAEKTQGSLDLAYKVKIMPNGCKCVICDAEKEDILPLFLRNTVECYITVTVFCE